jgi:hypothetical protein
MNPLQVTENACKALVVATIVSQSLSIPTTSVFTGIATDDDALPCVVCYASSAPELEPNSKIDWWKVKVNVVVFHPAGRSERDTANDEARKIHDAFFSTTARNVLTNITGSIVVADILDRSYFATVQQDAWAQGIEFMAAITPHDLNST